MLWLSLHNYFRNKTTTRLTRLAIRADPFMMGRQINFASTGIYSAEQSYAGDPPGWRFDVWRINIRNRRWTRLQVTPDAGDKTITI